MNVPSILRILAVCFMVGLPVFLSGCEEETTPFIPSVPENYYEDSLIIDVTDIPSNNEIWNVSRSAGENYSIDVRY